MPLDLGDLGLDRGGHVLVKHHLAQVAVGETVAVTGTAPELGAELRAWCRSRGHEVRGARVPFTVVRSAADVARHEGADRTRPQEVVEAPPARWGFAPRGALVEQGATDLGFTVNLKAHCWADEAARLSAQAAAAQWDPATAVAWDAAFQLPPAVENAVVQVMTYLVENETAALIVPARFAGRVHPHFREVMQLLAIQAADEARHMEVFTRRGLLRGDALGLTTAGGQASLATLLEEQEFALASFLLSVLGEGTFLSLLAFLREHAPDPVTLDVTRLAAQDEARHVAFGLAHLARHSEVEPGLRARLAGAIQRRHAALAATAGLNDEVFDALVLLAAGSWAPSDVRRGWDAVVGLQEDMATGRQKRLERLGFSPGDAGALSALHTRNFM